MCKRRNLPEQGENSDSASVFCFAFPQHRVGTWTQSAAGPVPDMLGWLEQVRGADRSALDGVASPNTVSPGQSWQESRLRQMLCEILGL